MKIRYIVLLLMFNNLYGQTVLDVSDPIALGDTEYGFIGPRVGIVADGSPVFMWGGNMAGLKLFFARKQADTITTPKILETGFAPYLSSAEGSSMIVRDDLIYVVYEKGLYGIRLLRSEDGGETFSDPIEILDPDEDAFLGRVGLLDDNNPIVAYIGKQGGQPVYKTVRSNDGGMSFETPAFASLTSNGALVCECCPSSIVSQGEDVFLGFRNNTADVRDLWMSVSEDGGQNYNTSKDLDDTDWIINSCPASGPSSLIDGENVITTWMSSISGFRRIFVNYMNRTTFETGPTINITNYNGPDLNFPVIAGRNDTIGIAWHSPTEREIYFAWTTTGIENLADNITQVTTSGSNRFASLAYDNGTFHLVYENLADYVIRYQTIRLTEATSTNPQLVENSIQIFPNPASKEIIIEHPTNRNNLRLVLTSVKGEVLVDRFLSGQQTKLNVVDYDKGIYFIKLIDGAHEQVEKVIIN